MTPFSQVARSGASMALGGRRGSLRLCDAEVRPDLTYLTGAKPPIVRDAFVSDGHGWLVGVSAVELLLSVECPKPIAERTRASGPSVTTRYEGWYKRHMIVPAEPDRVLSALGNQVVSGLASAVGHARHDLKEWRLLRPDWVAQSSGRGLANWLHDRLWSHLVTELDQVTNVKLVDSEPIREVWVGHRYRVRIKKHSVDAKISTYPTNSAMAFFSLPPPTLDTLEQINLAAGYEWDDDSRSISRAVLSLRSSIDRPLWMVEIPEGISGVGDVRIIRGPDPEGPSLPVITIGEDEGSAEQQ